MIPNTPSSSNSSSFRSPESSLGSSNRSGYRTQAVNHDHIRVENDNDIMSQFINPELEVVVMFSCRLKKWNKYGIKQDRNFVVTNLNLYNFK